MKIQNALYTMKYDGNLLSYQCKGLACSVFGMLGWTKRFEIPVNTLLYRQSRYLGFFTLTKLYINHYSHGQKKLTTMSIGHFVILGMSKAKVKGLIEELDLLIDQNLQDDINLGLNHISKSDLALFRARTKQEFPRQEVSREIPQPGMATMRVNKISKAS